MVLTHEDATLWGALPNLEVIPNAVLSKPQQEPVVKQNRVIAVGRLDYQKGFDRLIEAWHLIPSSSRNGWTLDIFGQGEWEGMLQEQIRLAGLEESVFIHKPVTDIDREYRKSRFIVMSSHFEGFGMVLVEAMVQGIPAIAFDCPCGPKDIICDQVNGLLIPEGDIPSLSRAVANLISNPSLLKKLTVRTADILSTFSEESVMRKWEDLFNKLTIAR